jgi:anhydro-N-acetylmuramic acid kinase
MPSEKPERILGVMIGSSMDGIDMAICRFQGDRDYHIERAEVLELAISWRENLPAFHALDAVAGKRADIAFGRYLGQRIKNWLGDDRVDLIGLHGFTVAHEPEARVSWQLGDGVAVTVETGIPTVDRLRDPFVLRGEEGAPLAPYMENALLPEHGLFANLGGIANASAHFAEGDFAGADLTGCNQVANTLAAEAGMTMDRDGQLSLGGQVLGELSEAAWAVVQARPVGKSLSNKWVSDILLPFFIKKNQPLNDRLATLYDHVARCLADFAAKHREGLRSESMLITGGGAYNDQLIAHITRHLEPIGVRIASAEPLMIDFKEALLVAWLARQHSRF